MLTCCSAAHTSVASELALQGDCRDQIVGDQPDDSHKGRQGDLPISTTQMVASVFIFCLSLSLSVCLLIDSPLIFSLSPARHVPSQPHRDFAAFLVLLSLSFLSLARFVFPPQPPPPPLITRLSLSCTILLDDTNDLLK